MLFFCWRFRFLFHHVASVRMQLGQHSIESLSGLSQTDIASAILANEQAGERASEQADDMNIRATLHRVPRYICEMSTICMYKTHLFVVHTILCAAIATNDDTAVTAAVVACLHSCISCYLIMYYHVKPDLLYNICQCLCLCAHAACVCIFINI